MSRIADHLRIEIAMLVTLRWVGGWVLEMEDGVLLVIDVSN